MPSKYGNNFFKNNNKLTKLTEKQNANLTDILRLTVTYEVIENVRYFVFKAMIFFSPKEVQNIKRDQWLNIVHALVMQVINLKNENLLYFNRNNQEIINNEIAHVIGTWNVHRCMRMPSVTLDLQSFTRSTSS